MTKKNKPVKAMEFRLNKDFGIYKKGHIFQRNHRGGISYYSALPPELNHGRRQGSLYNSDEEELGEYIKLKVITPIINRSKR